MGLYLKCRGLYNRVIEIFRDLRLHRSLVRVTGRQTRDRARDRAPWHQHCHYKLQTPEHLHLLLWESMELYYDEAESRWEKWMHARWVSDSHKMPTDWLALTVCVNKTRWDFRKHWFPNEKLKCALLDRRSVGSVGRRWIVENVAWGICPPIIFWTFCTDLYTWQSAGR